MKRYQLGVAALGVAALGIGGALALTPVGSGNTMHRDGYPDHMAAMSSMNDGSHADMHERMRAILGDAAYERMAEYMSSAAMDGGHMNMMMRHMGPDGETMK